MNVLDVTKKIVKGLLPGFLTIPGELSALSARIDETRILTARILIRQMKERGILESLKEAEFKVFSQFGDDGIIQYIVHRTGISPEEESFVEFGVGDYSESNTRFLLLNDNWRGLVMDSDAGRIASLRNSDLFWRHDLTAVPAFVNRENLDDLLHAHGFERNLGLLHIDIDGNDYWVWEALGGASPVIVVMEYNSVFGPERAVTIPYDPSFRRTRAHHSNLYWGCSLKALCLLGEKKGYAFAGTNSHGNNAYFVRKDRAGNLRLPGPETGFVASRFRESRDEKGRLTYLSGKSRLGPIAHLPLFDLERQAMVRVEELAGNAGQP